MLNRQYKDEIADQAVSILHEKRRIEEGNSENIIDSE